MPGCGGAGGALQPRATSGGTAGRGPTPGTGVTGWRSAGWVQARGRRAAAAPRGVGRRRRRPGGQRRGTHRRRAGTAGGHPGTAGTGRHCGHGGHAAGHRGHGRGSGGTCGTSGTAAAPRDQRHGRDDGRRRDGGTGWGPSATAGQPRRGGNAGSGGSAGSARQTLAAAAAREAAAARAAAAALAAAAAPARRAGPVEARAAAAPRARSDPAWWSGTGSTRPAERQLPIRRATTATARSRRWAAGRGRSRRPTRSERARSGLNGTSSTVGAYVNVPDSLNGMGATTAVTIACWVNVTTARNWQRVWDFNNTKARPATCS